MEIICTKCYGLGEQRMYISQAHPLMNAYGWSYRYDLGYMFRPCMVCDGHGFRPSCSGSVPIVLKKTA